MHKHIITATILTLVLVPVVVSAATVSYENGTITVSALEAGNQIIFFDNNGDYDTSFTSDGSFEPSPELYTSPFRYVEVNTTNDPYSISCGTYDECLGSANFILASFVASVTAFAAAVLTVISENIVDYGSAIALVLGSFIALALAYYIFKFGYAQLRYGTLHGDIAWYNARRRYKRLMDK